MVFYILGLVDRTSGCFVGRHNAFGHTGCYSTAVGAHLAGTALDIRC